MAIPKPRTARLLTALQVLFYVAFVFLWFKGNYPSLKRIPVPPWIPFAGLVLVTALRVGGRLKRRPRTFRLRVTRDTVVCGLILVLILAVHIPFLLAHDGLMDSDEAIPALQGKHIAEGKLPTVFYYGARFQGSLPQHYYALLFAVIGYSVFLAKLAALLAFLAFIAVQYALVKKNLSREFAVLATLFYLLPFKNLTMASFDIGSGFPVVFLLGILILTMTGKICQDKNDRLLPTLGFLMGLAFWTHQIAIVFLLTSGVFLVLHYRAKVERYLVLAFFFLVGAFPLIVSEVYWKFPLYHVLFKEGSAWTLGAGKLANGAKLALDLVSPGPTWANAAFFGISAAGLILLAVRAVREKKAPVGLYAAYTPVYAVVYFLSSSSSDQIVRYLYILYVALPVILVAALFWIKPKFIRGAAVAVLFLWLFLTNGLKDATSYYREVREFHGELTNVVAAMEATGDKYWSGDYWISYLLTAVTAERFVIASTGVVRYPFYDLVVQTEAARTNRVFWFDAPVPGQEKEAQDFIALLKQAGKKFETASPGRWRLVFGAEGYVYEQNKRIPPPEIPDVVFAGFEPAAADIVLRFTSKKPLAERDFQLFAEIPGFCSRFSPIGPGSEFIVRIPYPPQRSVRLRYYLCHLGLLLDPTVRETDIALPEPPPAPAKEPIELLSGVGPPETATGNRWPVLGRIVSVRINRLLTPASTISISLYSPYLFDKDPFWHGDFAQDVDIQVNGMPFRKIHLADGLNKISLNTPFPLFSGDENILTLKFTYSFVMSINDYWKTAAFLENLSLE